MPASTSSVSNASDGGFNTGITTPDQGLIGSSAELDLLRKQIAELQAGQASLLAAQSIARQDSSAVEELTKTLKKAMTVSPEDSEDPDNAGRMISKTSGFCFVPGDEYKEKTWWKAGMFALAAPGAIEAGKVPLAAIGSAVSNVNTALDTDLKTHAQSWWDTATGFGSKIGGWTSSALSEATSAISSIDEDTLTKVGLSIAGTAAVAGVAYGAYKYMTRQATDTAGDKTTTAASVKTTASSITDDYRRKLDTNMSYVMSMFEKASKWVPQLELPGEI